MMMTNNIIKSKTSRFIRMNFVLITGVDCEKSRNAEVDTLMADSRNWAANGYVEVRDLKTGGTPLHVAAAKGYLEVSRSAYYYIYSR